MAKILSSNHIYLFSLICVLYSEKKYKEAEKLVILVFEKFLSKKNPGRKEKESDLILLEALSADFNKLYRRFLKTHGFDDVPLENKYNHFIHNTTNPEKMTNLLYELGSCLRQEKNGESRKKIRSYLKEYRKLSPHSTS